jgi:hypothetical protein
VKPDEARRILAEHKAETPDVPFTEIEEIVAFAQFKGLYIDGGKRVDDDVLRRVMHRQYATESRRSARRVIAALRDAGFTITKRGESAVAHAAEGVEG